MTGLLEEIGLQDEMIDITKLFTSEEENNRILKQFEERIPQIHRNPIAQKLAKNKVQLAFNIFVEKVKSIL